MSYIKCGLTQCDVYYSEILVGQLYVGDLFTINGRSQIADFCPQELIASSKESLLFIKSKCQGQDVFNFFKTSFSYKANPVNLITDIPEDIKEEKDLAFKLYDNYNYPSELYIFYSVTASKFYTKYADSEQEGDYVDL